MLRGRDGKERRVLADGNGLRDSVLARHGGRLGTNVGLKSETTVLIRVAKVSLSPRQRHPQWPSEEGHDCNHDGPTINVEKRPYLQTDWKHLHEQRNEKSHDQQRTDVRPKE